MHHNPELVEKVADRILQFCEPGAAHSEAQRDAARKEAGHVLDFALEHFAKVTLPAAVLEADELDDMSVIESQEPFFTVMADGKGWLCAEGTREELRALDGSFRRLHVAL